jgi:hypothetical protein
LASTVTEALREPAGGREDLVTEAAGILGRWWTVRAEIEEGWAPIGAGLLILAGLDRDQLQHWVDMGREPVRAATSWLLRPLPEGTTMAAPHRKEHHERADDQCPADRADSTGFG